MHRWFECRVQPGKVLSPIAGCGVAVSAWILAWLAVLCLLWSVGLETRALHQPQAANRSAGKSREVVSFASYRILPSLRTKFIPSRTSPPQPFFPPGFLLRFLSAEDAGPAGPPWLNYRGPPVRAWRPRESYQALVTPAALSKRVERCFLPEISEIPTHRKFLLN